MAHPKPAPPDPTALKNETDCAMRSLFVAYAASVNHNVDARMAAEMIDALAGILPGPAHMHHRVLPDCLLISTHVPTLLHTQQRI